MTGMLVDPQLDPMGALITELRADPDVAALVGSRVRGFEPAPVRKDAAGAVVDQGDARGPGEYIAFVILQALDVPPHPRVPITFGDYLARAYGSTPQHAWAVWGALVKALHGVGARRKTNGLGIYRTSITSGGTQDKDPDTQQPLVTGTIRIIATVQAIA